MAEFVPSAARPTPPWPRQRYLRSGVHTRPSKTLARHFVRDITEAPANGGGHTGASGSVWGEPVMGREAHRKRCSTPACVFSATQVDLTLAPFCCPGPATLNHFG